MFLDTSEEVQWLKDIQVFELANRLLVHKTSKNAKVLYRLSVSE